MNSIHDSILTFDDDDFDRQCYTSLMYRLNHHLVNTWIISYGHIHLLEWIFAYQIYDWTHISYACAVAAKYGQLTCLQFLFEHMDMCFEQWTSTTYSQAIVHGQLECLQFAHFNKCPCFPNNSTLCSIAAFYGELDCLKFMHQHGYPWDDYTCRVAACNNHIECIHYLLSNGCPYNKNICIQIARDPTVISNIINEFETDSANSPIQR